MRTTLSISSMCPAIVIASLVPCLGAGCSTAPAVSARNTDAEIRAALAANIPPQSTLDDVNRHLDELGVSRKYRMDYPAAESRPRVLLARLFEPGGFWLDDENDLVDWVDVSFVFSTPPERLERTVLFRDKLRYFQGEAIVYPHAPKRALMARPDRFPSSIPPPIDPLEGAE